jgi:branched-subunit amino acid aminotransferase/4-amino-4-deoxychorismate lyase
MTQIYWGGKLWNRKRVALSPLNTGLFYGESLFETIPVYAGRPLFWEDHLERLQNGCRFLKWPFPREAELKKAILLFTLKNEALPSFLIRFMLVQEMKENSGPKTFSREPPHLFAFSRPLRQTPGHFWPLQGKAGISSWNAPSAHMVPNQFKVPFYLTTRAVFRDHPEWDEILRLNEKKEVVDGAGSTPFWFDGKKVWVSPLKLGGLESVTRKKIIQLCRKNGISLLEKPWKPQEALKKGELFFAGSGVGVMAITHLGGRKLKGSGLMAFRLWQHYRKWAMEGALLDQ